jgi:hypothetical protein
MNEEVEIFFRFSVLNPSLTMKELCKLFYYVALFPRVFNVMKLRVQKVRMEDGEVLLHVFYRERELDYFKDIDTLINFFERKRRQCTPMVCPHREKKYTKAPDSTLLFFNDPPGALQAEQKSSSSPSVISHGAESQ